MTGTLFALIAFLAVQLTVGVVISRRIQNEADYLIGGRRLGYLLATFSIFATWFGAETIVGSAGEVYSTGLTLASAEPVGYGLCLVIVGALLARPLWKRGLTTLADLYRQRFGTGVERLAAIILIPGSVLWAAAQIRAFGQVVATAGSLPVTGAIVGASCFVVAYTSFGGLLADAVNDVMQGVLLIVALVIMLVAVVLAVGGPSEAFAVLRASERIQLTPAASGPWIELVEAWAVPIIGSLMATEIIGRVISTRSPEVAQRSALGAGALYIAVGSIPVIIALLGAPLVADLGHAEQLLPTIARDILPIGLFAVFAGGLVAAILSTVDSTLLMASGLLSHNLLVPTFRISNERAKVRLARGGVALFGLIATLLALNTSSVLALVEEASSFGSAGVFVTSLFALFTGWGSARTAALTLLGGLTVYIGASLAGATTPFLFSCGGSLLIWGIGCATDSAAS